MSPSESSTDLFVAFIQRWESSGAAERAKSNRVAELLEILASLGQIREVEGGRFAA
jgi:hypothetical protein